MILFCLWFLASYDYFEPSPSASINVGILGDGYFNNFLNYVFYMLSIWK